MDDKPHIAFTWQGNSILRAIIIGVEISVPDGTKHEYQALIDTGATHSAVTKKVADELGLIQSGLTRNHTAGGLVENAKTYVVDIYFKGGSICFKKYEVVEVQLTAGNYEMLIGMDIITQGDFAITHKDGKTKLTFSVPPTRDFDFVPESNNHNRFLQEKQRREANRVNKKKK